MIQESDVFLARMNCGNSEPVAENEPVSLLHHRSSMYAITSRPFY